MLVKRRCWSKGGTVKRRYLPKGDTGQKAILVKRRYWSKGDAGQKAMLVKRRYWSKGDAGQRRYWSKGGSPPGRRGDHAAHVGVLSGQGEDTGTSENQSSLESLNLSLLGESRAMRLVLGPAACASRAPRGDGAGGEGFEWACGVRQQRRGAAAGAPLAAASRSKAMTKLEPLRPTGLQGCQDQSRRPAAARRRQGSRGVSRRASPCAAAARLPAHGPCPARRDRPVCGVPANDDGRVHVLLGPEHGPEPEAGHS